MNFGVQRLHASLSDVALPIGLRLDDLKLMGGPAELQTEPWGVKTESAATLVVRISEQNLVAFLEKQAPGAVRGVKVHLADGQVTVEAAVRVLVDIPVKAICALRIHGEKQLFVDLVEVQAVAAARKVVENQIAKANPVLDVKDLPFNVLLKDVQVADGFVTVTGSARP